MPRRITEAGNWQGRGCPRDEQRATVRFTWEVRVPSVSIRMSARRVASRVVVDDARLTRRISRIEFDSAE